MYIYRSVQAMSWPELTFYDWTILLVSSAVLSDGVLIPKDCIIIDNKDIAMAAATVHIMVTEKL